MSTDYSEAVERKAVVGTATLPAPAERVRFVYRLDEQRLGAGALTDPGSAADGSRLSLAEVIHYDSFGNLMAVREDEQDDKRTESLADWCDTPVELDTDPDWICLPTRWYDPNPGRWTAEDPLGGAADDPNLYRFVGGRGAEIPIPVAEAPQP
ncbi:MAG: hypothetical protein HYS12_07735 [Planctomycetes bacterium]|nr:hypothetical protein [Planctomycetota bacterium]